MYFVMTKLARHGDEDSYDCGVSGPFETRAGAEAAAASALGTDACRSAKVLDLEQLKAMRKTYAGRHGVHACYVYNTICDMLDAIGQEDEE